MLNKVFMIGCMTCPWAPTAGATTAQSGQRNDGVTAPNTQQLHHRLGHINRTLHADIEKPTTLVKTFNNLHKINVYVFMKKKPNVVEQICIWLLEQYSTVIHNKQYTTQQTIHNTKYSCYIISFAKFCGRFGRFWRGGLFELDWFRDKRQLNSLLSATENGC